MTLTTVGYGDLSPSTFPGKLIGELFHNGEFNFKLINVSFLLLPTRIHNRSLTVPQYPICSVGTFYVHVISIANSFNDVHVIGRVSDCL